MRSENSKHCWLLTIHCAINLLCEVTGREMNYVSWVDFFFLKKVGGSRDLFLFKRLEQCNGMAMCLQSGLCHCLTRHEQSAAVKSVAPPRCCGTLLDVLYNIWASLPLSCVLISHFLKYDLTPRGMTGFPQMLADCFMCSDVQRESNPIY